jgi:hypothetical protein
MSNQEKNLFDYVFIGMAVCLGVIAFIPFGFFALVGLIVSAPFLIYSFLEKQKKRRENEWEIQKEREREERVRWDSRMKQWRDDL